jgi:hypothetical protein
MRRDKTKTIKAWQRYATAQGYATLLPGARSCEVAALAMTGSVLGLKGSGVLLGGRVSADASEEARCERAVRAFFGLALCD